MASEGLEHGGCCRRAPGFWGLRPRENGGAAAPAPPGKTAASAEVAVACRTRTRQDSDSGDGLGLREAGLPRTTAAGGLRGRMDLPQQKPERMDLPECDAGQRARARAARDSTGGRSEARARARFRASTNIWVALEAHECEAHEDFLEAHEDAPPPEVQPAGDLPGGLCAPFRGFDCVHAHGAPALPSVDPSSDTPIGGKFTEFGVFGFLTLSMFCCEVMSGVCLTKSGLILLALLFKVLIGKVKKVYSK